MARVIRNQSPQGQNILIFGINFWPEQLGIAPYTTALAEHLASTGREVTVVTGFPHYPEWKRSSEFDSSRGRPEVRNGVSIIRRRHFIPSQPSALNRGRYELSFLTSSLGTLLTGKPDLVLGISPSVSGGLLAAAAATRFRAPYGIWFQDLTGRAANQSGIAGGERVAAVADALEANFARRAAMVGIIAEGFRTHLVAQGVDPSRIRTLRNWSHIGAPTLDAIAARQRLGLPDDAFICLHAGNMGQKQGLENIVDAARIAAAQPDSPLFILQGDGNTRADLERRAAGLPNLRFLPPQPEADFPNALAAADILLVNQKPAITDMCLPGKLTSYFAANRPVIAAVNQSSETAAELRRANSGLIVPAGDPQALLDGIQQLRTDPALGQTLARNALHFAETELTAAAAFTAIDTFIDLIAVSTGRPAARSAGMPMEAD